MIEKLTNINIQLQQSELLNVNFCYPSANSFIPNDFRLITYDKVIDDVPRLIQSTQSTRLWYKGDNKYQLPKVNLRFELRNYLINASPVNLNMVNIFIRLFNDSLSEVLCEALQAGMRYEVFTSSNGLSFSFSGFNDKMNLLLDLVFEALITFEIDLNIFKEIKESVSVADFWYEFVAVPNMRTADLADQTKSPLNEDRTGP